MRETIKVNSGLIAGILSQQIDINNPDEIMLKLEEISVLLALSSETVALSKQLLHKAENESIIKIMQSDNKLPASILKKQIEAECHHEIYLSKLSERQNAALVHSGDMLRSALSYLKAEMSNL